MCTCAKHSSWTNSRPVKICVDDLLFYVFVGKQWRCLEQATLFPGKGGFLEHDIVRQEKFELGLACSSCYIWSYEFYNCTPPDSQTWPLLIFTFGMVYSPTLEMTIWSTNCAGLWCLIKSELYLTFQFKL